MAALYWKAWRESRGRFLTALPVMMAACVVSARSDLSRLMIFPPPTLEQYIWNSVYDGAARLLFVLAALTLGLGGVRAERISGSEAFTLSLPVMRHQLVLTRAITGAAQVVVLAMVPLVIIPAVTARYQDHVYPAVQAWRFFGLFAAAGFAWFAIGFFSSVIFSGEYTAAAVSLVTPLAIAGVTSAPGLQGLRPLNLFNIMSGADLSYLDARRRLLIAMPWETVVAVMALATVLLWAAVRAVEADG